MNRRNTTRGDARRKEAAMKATHSSQKNTPLNAEPLNSNSRKKEGARAGVMDSFDDSSAATPVAAATPFSFFDMSRTLERLNNSTVKIRDVLQSPQQSKDVLTSALGNGLLLLVVAFLWLAYRVMESFLRPIVWALLVGAGVFLFFCCPFLKLEEQVFFH